MDNRPKKRYDEVQVGTAEMPAPRNQIEILQKENEILREGMLKLENELLELYRRIYLHDQPERG